MMSSAGIGGPSSKPTGTDPNSPPNASNVDQTVSKPEPPATYNTVQTEVQRFYYQNSNGPRAVKRSCRPSFTHKESQSQLPPAVSDSERISVIEEDELQHEEHNPSGLVSPVKLLNPDEIKEEGMDDVIEIPIVHDDVQNEDDEVYNQHHTSFKATYFTKKPKEVEDKQMTQPLLPLQPQMLIFGEDPALMEYFHTVEELGLGLRHHMHNVRRHDCGPECITVGRFNPYVVPNPYTIPLRYGFYRAVLYYSSKDEDSMTLAYITPCGKYLTHPLQVISYLEVVQFPLDIEYFIFSKGFFLEMIRIPRDINYIEDITLGAENIPISAINTIDDEMFRPNFQYEAKRYFHPDLQIDETVLEEFRSCCDCEDYCYDWTKCSCQKLTYESNCGEAIGYDFKRLEAPLKMGIYECNDDCRCAKGKDADILCPNRVVQNGIKVRMQVFKTHRSGWGLRTCHYIPKGAFVCTYSGRIINDALHAHTEKCIDKSYLADMDFYEEAFNHVSSRRVKWDHDLRQAQEEEQAKLAKQANEQQETNSQDGSEKSDKSRAEAGEAIDANQPGCSNGQGSFKKPTVPVGRKPNRKRMKWCKPKPKGKQPKPAVEEFEENRNLSREALLGEDVAWSVDGSSSSNVGRLFNHSCSPNLFVQNVFIETHDLRFNHIALFAARDIEPFEELTWDYNYVQGSDPYRIMICNCSSNNCRRRLL